MATAPTIAPYRPRRPRESPLYRLIERFFPQFEEIYPERYEKRYGYWRPIMGRVARKFLRCGDGSQEQIAIDRSLVPAARGASAQTWAMLLRRVYEVDPLICPHCGSAMRVVSFIEARQQDVIEKILRHCGLWSGAIKTLAAARPPPDRAMRYVPWDEVEFQTVLDPEFL